MKDRFIKTFDRFDTPCPRRFGCHPDYWNSYWAWRRRMNGRKCTAEERLENAFGRPASLKEFGDEIHPGVYLLPRSKHLDVRDSFGGPIVNQTLMPFSSFDFFVDFEMEDLPLTALYESSVLRRLGCVHQLAYLVPPRPSDWGSSIEVFYTPHTFTHTRWIHSMIVAILAEVVMARNGFAESERAPFVLACGCHDIATPAGGDSIKRMDREGLDEEKNFAGMMNSLGVSERWKEKFGFDIEQAEQWIFNRGVLGKLLDVVDKISYVALDCYSLGSKRNGHVRRFALAHPLVIDVWQDVRFNSDKTEFGFTDADRLYDFLMLRALEHLDLLFDPYSRIMDTYLETLARPLYEKGILNKENLLANDDMWLLKVLGDEYPTEISGILSPEKLDFRRFKTEAEQKACIEKLGDRVTHTDRVKGFKTGLDWLVWVDGRLSPLRDVIAQEKVAEMEAIVESTRWYYVYFRK